MTLDVDRTTQLFIEALVEHAGRRPPDVDLDQPLLMIALSARRLDEHERNEEALRLIIGARLTQAAIRAHAVDASTPHNNPT